MFKSLLACLSRARLRVVRSVLLASLCASLLTACAQSEALNELPNLPTSVRHGGSVTPWPEAKPQDPEETTMLLAVVRENELRQARAVNSCKEYHQQLQLLVKKK